MHLQSFLPLALAATALAGHSSALNHMGPGMLLTGCPDGYTNIVTGACKPFHLRIRDASTGDWRSHQVTDVYRVGDHPYGGLGAGSAGDWDDGKWVKGGILRQWVNGRNGEKDTGGKKAEGREGVMGGKHRGTDHCPNGVANHASGECKPFRVHARDAENGEWRSHSVTGAYHIPDEKPGHGGPGFDAFGGAAGGARHDGRGRMHARDAQAEPEPGMGRPGGFGGFGGDDVGPPSHAGAHKDGHPAGGKGRGGIFRGPGGQRGSG